jgi:hypothetical protein
MFTSAVEGGKAFVLQQGVPGAAAEPTALKRIYGQLVRQATAMGFNDTFFILSVLMACVLPLVLLLRRPEHQRGTAPPAR